MEDPRPSVTLLIIVLSILLRFNGAVFIWTNRKKISVIPSVLLNLFSPILCLSIVSYVTGRTYEKDREDPLKGSIGYILSFLGSQFISGLIFVGFMFLLGSSIPSGRAIGPGSSGGGFNAFHIFFILSLASFLFFLILLILRPEKDPVEYFKGRKMISTTVISLLSVIPIIAVGALIMGFMGEIGAGESPTLVEGVEKPIDMVLAGMAIVVIAPLIEELLFRGYLYDQIGKRFSPLLTILITGALFAGAHLSPVTFIPILMMGMLMGWLRYRSDSIVPPLILHCANNLVGLIVIINQS